MSQEYRAWKCTVCEKKTKSSPYHVFSLNGKLYGACTMECVDRVFRHSVKLNLVSLNEYPKENDS